MISLIHIYLEEDRVMKLFSTIAQMWRGFFCPLFIAVIYIVIIYLNRLRRGLIKGFLKTAVNIVFWPLAVCFTVFQLYAVLGYLFSGRIIQFVLCAAVIFFACKQLFGKIRTTKLADSIDARRISRSGLTQMFVDRVSAQRPARIDLFSDRLVFHDSLPLPDQGETRSEEMRFDQYGYGEMDSNAKRTLANMIAERAKDYTVIENEISHEEEVVISGGSGSYTGTVDSSGNISISGGGSGPVETTMAKVIDGYDYTLLRNDLIPDKPANETAAAPVSKLKKW